MILADALREVRSLYLDTSPVIYFLERDSAYAEIVNQIFSSVDKDAFTVVTSTITVTETLVKPFQANDAELYLTYRNWFLETKNLSISPVSIAVAERAAQLRAAHNLKTPDAIHLATAIDEKCDALLTNDTIFRRAHDIRVILVSELEPD